MRRSMRSVHSTPVGLVASLAVAALLRALGSRRRDSLVTVALDHAGINRMLGSPHDTTRETEAVMAFVDRAA